MGNMEYRIHYQQWRDAEYLEPELKRELDAIKDDEKSMSGFIRI